MILFPRGKICVSETINIEIVLTVHDKTFYIPADHPGQTQHMGTLLGPRRIRRREKLTLGLLSYLPNSQPN